jgi:tetratricopeptide (TPR) repeat protein
LRQHSGDNTAHFFDWLRTPAQGLIDLVRNDFPVFRPEDLVLLNAGTRISAVEHVPTGIGFGHQFPRRGKVIPADFLADYPAFASRVDYLATRFRDTVRAHPVQFVRRDMTREQALDLEAAMQSRFPSADMRFLYVNAHEHTFETPLGRSLQLPAPRTPFGDSLAWTAMLRREGLVENPFRLAPAQIVRSSSNNQLEEADGHPLDALLEGRRRNPDNPWFAYELGWKQLQRRRYGRAARLAREALAAGPDNPDFIELKLRVDLARFRLRRESALREALSALERTPHPGLWNLAADLMLALKRPWAALDHVERGLASRPYSDELQLRKARALFAAGRLAEAESAIDVALSLHPQGKAYVELKAIVLRSLGRGAEAHDLLSDVLRNKRSYRLQILRARLALGARRWPLARRPEPASAAPSSAATALGRVDSA